MPPSIYRSRFFWFGLPGFLLLLWMWLGFMEMGRIGRAVANSRTADYSGSWGRGEIGFSRVNKPYDVTTIGTTTIHSHRKHGFKSTSERENPGDPTQLLGTDFYQDSAATGFTLDFWFFAVTYSTLWIGGTVLWNFRRQRLTVLA